MSFVHLAVLLMAVGVAVNSKFVQAINDSEKNISLKTIAQESIPSQAQGLSESTSETQKQLEVNIAEERESPVESKIDSTLEKRKQMEVNIAEERDNLIEIAAYIQSDAEIRMLAQNLKALNELITSEEDCVSLESLIENGFLPHIELPETVCGLALSLQLESSIQYLVQRSTRLFYPLVQRLKNTDPQLYFEEKTITLALLIEDYRKNMKPKNEELSGFVRIPMITIKSSNHNDEKDERTLDNLTISGIALGVSGAVFAIFACFIFFMRRNKNHGKVNQECLNSVLVKDIY